MPTGAQAFAEPVTPAAPIERLRRRADFLRAARSGRKAAMRSLVLQARKRDAAEPCPSGETGPSSDTDTAQTDRIRIGFTVSRKVGNAVERNRARRRLREAVRARAAACARAGHDYVVIGRRAALTTPFARILSDLEAAFRKVHEKKPERRNTDEPPHHKAQNL